MTRLIPVHSDILVTFFTSSDCCNDFDTFVKGLPCNPNFLVSFSSFFLLGMAASLARRVLAVTFVYLYDEDMSYNPNC